MSRLAPSFIEFLDVKTKDGQTVSVQMSLRDKLKALEMAGKNLGILADVGHSGADRGVRSDGLLSND